MDMTEIAIITHPYFYKKTTGRGQDRYSYELIKGLEENFYKVKVLHTGYNKNQISAIFKECIFPLKLFSIKSNLFHAIDPIGGKTAVYLKKKPLIVTIHDIVPFQYQDIKHRYQQWCTKVATKKSDAIIVPYPSTKNFLEENFCIDPKKIKIIPYGVDHTQFYPRKIKKEDSKFVILYIGEIVRSKGVDTLVKSFRLFVNKVENSILLIGGKGKDTLYIKKLISDLNIGEKVEFLGFVPEKKLPFIYSSANVCVFPSRIGFGLPALEAMACGCPAILGNSLDAKDFVGNDKIPLLINPNNPGDLTKVFYKLYENIELRKELISKSIKKAQKYTWRKTIDKTIELYKAVLS